jgi:steroid 5-alpha reductase family enzyme
MVLVLEVVYTVYMFLGHLYNKKYIVDCVWHQIFAGMRKSPQSKHGIPTGGLFSLVSCPHYLSEVLIYTVLMLVRILPME